MTTPLLCLGLAMISAQANRQTPTFAVASTKPAPEWVTKAKGGPEKLVEALKANGWIAELVEGIVYAVEPEVLDGPAGAYAAEFIDVAFGKVGAELARDGVATLPASALSPQMRAALEPNLLALAPSDPVRRDVIDGRLEFKVVAIQSIEITQGRQTVRVSLERMKTPAEESTPPGAVAALPDPRSLTQEPDPAVPLVLEPTFSQACITLSSRLVGGMNREGMLAAFGRWLDRQWGARITNRGLKQSVDLAQAMRANGFRPAGSDQGPARDLPQGLYDRLLENLSVMVDGRGQRVVSDPRAFLAGAEVRFNQPFMIVFPLTEHGGMGGMPPDLWFLPLP